MGKNTENHYKCILWYKNNMHIFGFINAQLRISKRFGDHASIQLNKENEIIYVQK